MATRQHTPASDRGATLTPASRKKLQRALDEIARLSEHVLADATYLHQLERLPPETPEAFVRSSLAYVNGTLNLWGESILDHVNDVAALLGIEPGELRE